MQKIKDFLATNKMGLLVGIAVGAIAVIGYNKYKSRGRRR